jgi:thiamine biosynthesis protein ThiI
MEKRCILIKLSGEISLKSEPVRRRFEAQLRRNIRAGLNGLNITDFKLYGGGGRLFLELGRKQATRKAMNLLQRIFGVHSVADAYCYENPSLEEIVRRGTEFALRYIKDGNSFAVRCSRAGKHTFTSQDVCVKLGAAILEKLPKAKVRLVNPEKEVFVEVRERRFYIYRKELAGYDGLPVGVEGKVALTFDGSREACIALWLLLRRGCAVTVVPNGKNKKRVKDALKKLVPWNCMQEFELVSGEVLPELLAKQKLLAIVSSESSLDRKALKRYAEFNRCFEGVVFRPLLLAPKPIIEKAARAIKEGYERESCGIL